MPSSRDARALVFGALVLGLTPDPLIMPSAWATDTLILADGPEAGQKWNPAKTPYAVEPLDCLAADRPHTLVSVRKSAQVGLTEAGIAWLGSVIDRTPAPSMIIFPTILAVDDFNSEKLQPSIEATPVLNRKIRVQKSRDNDGSTKRKKRFPGGTLALTGANSAADLRSKTVKYQFRDEIDEWPLDLAGQGDPMKMADARQMAYHASGDYKTLQCSTPTIKGASRIDDVFEAGDQRFFYVPCPHCGEMQRLEFGGKDTPHGLKFEKTFPHNAHYVCAAGGCVIEHHDKPAMVRAGEWRAHEPGLGRQPSFHINALYSLLTTWDKMAEAWLDAQGDPKKLKAFVNLWLGESWEERGEAPDWKRLHARREAYVARTIPPGGLLITTAVDVQLDGLYYETVAWGRDKQSWSIDAGFLDGPTSDTESPVWAALGEVYERLYPDAQDNQWPADLFGIDAGFNANQVYLFTRGRPRAMNLKGQDGWARGAISSAPSQVDISWRGKRMNRGAKLWSVGIWPLKSELYANLRKDGRKDGAEMDSPGYCHFAEFHDERFFKQLTAEHIDDEHTINGRHTKRWVAAGPNHFHDCRIYNMALAERLGLSRNTPAEWEAWARHRGAPPVAKQPDLEDLMTTAPAPSTPPPAKQSAKPKPEMKTGWLGGRARDWWS